MRSRCLFIIAGICLTFVLGCGGGSGPDAAVGNANKSNIQRLANLYVLHQFQNKLQGPKDEAAYKAFISAVDANALSKMGIQATEIDQLFICERDDEPFKIKYGVPTSTRGSDAPVIFEATGSGGKRMVGFLNMVQREVDSAEYDQLWGSTTSPKNRNLSGAR